MSFSVQVHEGVAFIAINTLDSQKNVVNDATLQQIDWLVGELKKFEGDSELLGYVVLSNKFGYFLTAVDFKLLNQLCGSSVAISRISKCLQKLCRCLEDLAKPSVALIDGQCSSFGFELALCCKHRIAVDVPHCVFGFPDVEWGLCPLAGGCLRLTRLLSLQHSLDLLLSGRVISAREALGLGLIDQLVSNAEAANLKQTAVSVLTGSLFPKPRNDCISFNLWESFYNAISFQWSHCRRMEDEILDSNARLYPAPMAVVQLVKQAVKVKRKAGEEERSTYDLLERSLCGQLASSPTGRRLLALQLNKDLSTVHFSSYLVFVFSKSPQVLKIFSQHECESQRALLTYYPRLFPSAGLKKANHRVVHCCVAEYSGFEEDGIDLLVVDVDEWKQRPRSFNVSLALLSSTAVPFDYDQTISQQTADQIVGIRCYSWLNSGNVLEIVVNHQRTSPTIAKVSQVARGNGSNVVLLVANTPGSFVLRILMAFIAEALQLLVEGRKPSKIDKRMKEFGYEVGIFWLMDQIGIDVIHRELSYMKATVNEHWCSSRVLQLLEVMIMQGNVGVKTGIGFYSKSNKPNQRLNQIFSSKYATESKFDRENKEMIGWRLTCRLANEAFLCLHQQIILSASDGDMALVYAVGFPPCYGGPLQWIDTQGASKIVQKMNEFRQKPCQLLINAATTNGIFV